MNDNLRAKIPQEEFNTLVLQMLLDISSRQRIYHIHLAQAIAYYEGLSASPETVASIVNRLEKQAEEMRIDLVKELYSKFGEISSEIIEALNPIKP